MGAANYLYRRPSGIYVVRICIPRKLHCKIGRKEVHISTGVRDMALAHVTALSILLHWKRKLMESNDMDLLKLAEGSPLLSGPGHLSVDDAAAALGMQTSTLLREIVNHRARLFCVGMGWTGYEVEDIDQVDREDDGIYIVDSAIAIGIEIQVYDLIQVVTVEGAVRQLVAEGRCSFTRCLIGETRAVFLYPFPTIKLSDVLLEKSALRRIRAGYISEVGPDAITFARSRLIVPSVTKAAAKHGEMRVSELMQLFLAAKAEDWKEDQRRRVPNQLQPFVDLMNDPRLEEVDRQMIQRYRKQLRELPADLRKARQENPKATSSDLIAWAQAENVTRMALRTVDSYVVKLSEMFNWAVQENYLRQNPAMGVASKKSGKREQDDRMLFSDDEMALIFGAKWFHDGRGEVTKKGRFQHYQPHFYWLPLLSLYTGGRLNELAQLYLDDIAQTREGVPFLHFRLNKPDKLDADQAVDRLRDKSLKTVNSERVVALHHHLLELGLLEYVQALRKQGYDRLFPELRHDRVKGYGKAAGSWFNERYLGKQLGMVRDGTKTFHSFRHMFITALSHNGTPELTIAQIVGHERGQTMSGKRYRKDQDANGIKSPIDAVSFALPRIARFDVQAGIQSVADAKRRKQSTARRRSDTEGA